MKIAVIAKTRLPIAEPYRGGLEAFTATLCRSYIEQGHDVTLYAHADSDPSLHVISFYGTEHREETSFEAYENDEYLSIIRDIESKPYDIVHNNSTHELPIIWGASSKIPVVTTLHAPPRFSKIKPAITAAAYSNNLHFVTISAALADMWRPYLQTEPTIIHNGINLSQWPLTRRSRDYLLWYGRMVPTKGLDIALDVAHKLQMPLHYAGSLDDQTYYDDYIKPRLQPSDSYLGHLDQAGIHHAMTGAAALVNAARWEEPFGLTTIEAMAAGVPIAGFDRGAFKEIITSGSGAVADGTTVSSLALATQQAMQLSSEQVHAEAARFDIKQMTATYLRYFEDII